MIVGPRRIPPSGGASHYQDTERLYDFTWGCDWTGIGTIQDSFLQNASFTSKDRKLQQETPSICCPLRTMQDGIRGAQNPI